MRAWSRGPGMTRAPAWMAAPAYSVKPSSQPIATHT